MRVTMTKVMKEANKCKSVRVTVSLCHDRSDPLDSARPM